MQIILNQTEIEDAVRAFVLGQIEIREDQEISIDFKATRGDEGMTALIAITKMAPPVEEPAPQTRTRAKKAATVTTEAPATQKTGNQEKATSEPPAAEETANDAAAQETMGQTVDEPAVIQAEKVDDEKPIQTTVAPVTPRIFGDAVSSAPIAAVAREPQDPQAHAKSLFSNLTKPVHQAASA